MASEGLVTQVQNDLQINLDATVAYVQANYLQPNIGFSVGNGLTAGLTANSISLDLDYTIVEPAFTAISGELVKGVEVNLGNNPATLTLGIAQAFKDSKQNTLQYITEDTNGVVINRPLRISAPAWLTPHPFEIHDTISGTFMRFVTPWTLDVFSSPTEGRRFFINEFSQGGLTVGGSIQCTSLTQTSDKRVKTNIRPVNADHLKAIFNAVDVKLYERTDGVEGTRVGFIAQDVQAHLPNDGSLDMLTPKIQKEDGDEDLLGIDYTRLVTVLWGVVKTLTSRIEALEANLPQ